MTAPGPMTEAAFRRAFSAATASRYTIDSPAADAAVAAAKVAGVVFAPEAPALPERVKLSGCFLLIPDIPGEAWRGANYPRELIEACAKAGRDRYNAWPRLREAAVQAGLAGRQLLTACAASTVRAHPQGMLDAALADLEAILAAEAQP